jgi:hypothetical protein
MYCPTCGTENQEAIRYCKKCGAVLTLIAEVISGKLTSASGIDARRVQLLKDYYNGRRSTVLGAFFLLVGLSILTPLMLNRAMDNLPVIGLFGGACLLYGAIALVWGIAHWMDTSSEMKAMEAVGRTTERQALSSGAAVISIPEPYATDPLMSPASVTETTTRTLDAHARPPADGERS